MGIVSELSKQRIRERVPLQDLVREYSVHLIPSGRRLKGLCPFHAEKTPSFSIDVERQYYYCFGCQAGGDLFSFVKNIQRVDYPEAVELLARRAGVTIEYEGGGHRAPQQERAVELYDALTLAQDFYHRYLLEDPAARVAREYLRNRGIEAATCERFRLGFSPPEWDGLLRSAARKGISAQILERAGLARARDGSSGHYDYFRGRVMFPIQDPQGRAIGFGARTLGDDQPKYLNTPKTSLFEKSQVLYALPQARMGIQREGRLAIVEGYTDAIMAHQAGLDYFVASLGTAFTQENARRLSRLAPQVFLVFDGDAAGQKASERSLDLLVPESVEVRVYSVKHGKDPCDAILSLGGEEFRRRMEAEAVGLFEFKWRRTMEGNGVASSGAVLKARALDEFLALLAKVPNVVARKLYMKEFSERLGISEKDIATRLQDVARKAAASPFASQRHSAAGGGQGPDVNAPPAFGESAGAAVRPVTASPGLASLADLVCECLLALPLKAPEIWQQLPKDLWCSRPHEVLAAHILRQIQGGALSTSLLAQEVGDPEAQQLLMRLLSRLEDDQGQPTQDYEEVWTRVERDLVRHVRRTRVEELKRQMALSENRTNGVLREALRREYFDVLRELKK